MNSCGYYPAMNSFTDESMLVNFSSVEQFPIKISRVSRTALPLVFCLVLASCGGGGSSVDSAPGSSQASNHSPTLTVAEIIELPEQQQTVVALHGHDPDGDALTYSVLGGSDHSAFDLSQVAPVKKFVRQLPEKTTARATYLVMATPLEVLA